VKEYLAWYDADRVGLGAVPNLPVDAPVVAVLLYRKHVITQQPYLADLVHALVRGASRMRVHGGLGGALFAFTEC